MNKTSPVRYAESKERSAELLRAVLLRMGQHEAPFNPETFAVWYEHLAGINARLSQALEEHLRAGTGLGEEAIGRLYREFVSEIDQRAVQRANADLQRLMSGMAETASRTGHRAGEFGAQLDSLTQALGANPAPGLAPIVSRAMAGTAEMKTSTETLRQQVVASGLEIERLRQDLVRARDEALLDTLTGTLNRKGFDLLMQAMLALGTEPGRAHCVVLFDIDHFKRINDTYGHMMGDRVLQAVAEALRSGLSSPAHRLARYGGEEFALPLPQSTADTAFAIADSLRQRVRAMKVRDRRTKDVVLTVTISAGVAAAGPGDDAPALIARADQALYAAKEAGRDRVHKA